LHWKMMARSIAVSGITAQKISKCITFYKNDTIAAPAVTQTGPKPLLLLLPWLGSRPRAVDKYCEIYLKTGFDVLVVESEVTHFLWPRWGLDYGAKILDVLQSQQFISRPLLVHSFSIGGFTFAQVMLHISRKSQQYQSLTNRIHGHIYDSLVVGSVERMATGVGKSMFPRLQGPVQGVSLLYFRVFKKYTVDYYNDSINVFWNTPVKAPALFFFCDNDPLSDSEEVEKLTGHWQTQGISVGKKRWKESIHAGHLREHPEDYLTTLHNFVQSLNLFGLKAKL
ncbi:TMM53 protein, partial [Amia calva]|nr:TMM53 protein [Amia calva]